MLVLKLIFHFVKPAVKFQPTYKHFQVDFSRFIFTNVPMEHVPEHFFLTHFKSLYLPQPKSGTWLIDLGNVTCIDEELKFNLTMNGCVDSCGEYDGRGECMTYYTEGNVIMSTCNCKAGNYILNVMLIIIQTVVNTFTSRTRDKADVSALMKSPFNCEIAIK